MMEAKAFLESPEIRDVVDGIVLEHQPLKIYIYNHRVNLDGECGSFKLCIIMETDDKLGSERDIYMDIDCDVPYDVLIYTPDEWEKITADPISFAGKIRQTGVLIYDKA